MLTADLVRVRRRKGELLIIDLNDESRERAVSLATRSSRASPRSTSTNRIHRGIAILEYRDCGLKNIWLTSGYRWEEVEGIGPCLEIEDIDGLHRAIGHHLVHYRKRLSGPEIRFIRTEIGFSQKRLADTLGVDEQTDYPFGSAAGAVRPWRPSACCVCCTWSMWTAPRSWPK